jgi:hypothetical protein
VVLVLASGAFLYSPPPSWVVARNDTYRISQLVGPGSINNTDTRWNVYGADLGHMFVYKQAIYMVFGDTFGGSQISHPFLGTERTDWRSNVMALVDTSQRPVNGLKFTGMITDRPGHAEEILPSKKRLGDEETVIPTYGVSVGNRMFLYYMSVRQFTTPGSWTVGYSGIAFSDDQGKTWTKDPNAIWQGNTNFAQVAAVPVGPDIYLYGIPEGRNGSLHLARVPQSQILDPNAYQYWTGTSWAVGNPQAAVPIVPAPVGELSVVWNSYYKKWIMLYADTPAQQVLLRMSDSPVGPWGGPKVVVTGSQFPQLSAPYITPLWNDRKDIYFTMSMFDPYQVFLMHTSLIGA